ncbi:glycosyltransferase [Spirosoma sp. KUDC1026]|uniref:glycosyltransferase n=1 Tax=Spirosoma sp. KUDC1026 TaxID=2745947 RepID=UPI001E37D6C3|nr:glycosyltransferase [Spirosoma sp. KUDC1026]
MKIALVQDGLMCRAGGEQVALCFHKAFPEAPIYTQCYQPSLTFPEFKEADIRTSWLQNIAKTDDRMKQLFFPLGVQAMQSHDLTDFDVVLMSGTHCAKYVKVRKNALVISYSFTPFRLAWNPESYAQYAEAGPIKRFVFDKILRYLRDVDFRFAQRPNYYVGMTDETAERLRSAYQIKKPIRIIKPPVSVNNFYVSNLPKEYFLIVSRLEYYKKVDLAIDAFNELGYPLVVVGKGLQAEEIKARAKGNVTFLSGLSAQQLADAYANCRAFIFPQHEDYGITPLEANAAGRPVIAYGVGGVLATQIPVKDDPAEATALFFDEQTVESLVKAVKAFEGIEERFNPTFIRQHAEAFDEKIFIEQIQQFVQGKYLEYKKHSVA